MLLTSRPLAEDWFAELRWSWTDPVADQRSAVVALGLLALVLLANSRPTGRKGGADLAPQKTPRSL